MTAKTRVLVPAAHLQVSSVVHRAATRVALHQVSMAVRREVTEGRHSKAVMVVHHRADTRLRAATVEEDRLQQVTHRKVVKVVRLALRSA